MASLMSGTSHLLVAGAQRQSIDDRERWLGLVASLMGVKLSISDNQISHEQLVVIDAHDEQQEKYQILTALNEQQTLKLELNSISEQIVSGTAFLILNELGRFPAEQRQQQFEQLTSIFPYTIARVSLLEQDFDSEQLERLSRGETLIIWHTEFGRSLYIDVYAPWGNSEDLLKLGSIKFFDPYPTWLMTLSLLVALIFLAIWVMVIIRKLSHNLMQLQTQVDAIEPEHFIEQPIEDSPDIMTQLTQKVDSMAKRIEKLLAQKSYMIRAVSHDLRTPLSKAQFRLESLAVELGDEHPMLSATKQNLGELNLMIDELLSYEKLSQSQSLKFEQLDVLAITQQVVQDIQIVYPNVDFQCNSEQDHCFAAINQTLFTRMLENLLNNAGNYCKTRVLVIVSEHASENAIELAIIDDGKGISTQAKESIFDPFFQEEQSRSNKVAGYGLGLAIVKQILLQHKATIRLADDSASTGAHFIVKIPTQQREQNEKQ